jgi:hypothetical protein
MSTTLRNDEGFAMAAVMGVIALVTVVAVGGFWVASQTLHESQRVEHESKAFQVAQSGLDRELAAFSPSELVSGSYTKSGSTPDGTYSITASQTTAFEYRMTSLGTAEGRQETVTQRFYYFNLWDMNIGTGQSAPLGGGRGFNGNAAIRGPLYVKGDFDFEQANATYEGGPLFVKGGDVIVGGSATIGYQDPIDLFLDGNITGNQPGSCYYKSWSSSVPDIELPWIDQDYMDAMYQKALDESIDNYMGYPARAVNNLEANGGVPSTYDDGSTIAGRVKVTASPASTSDSYKYIGNSGGPQSLGNGNHFLEIDNVSFGAWDGAGYPVGSGLHDDFAFDAGTGTLYVEGTVFIDGDLHLGQNIQTYKGNGTLVVNGDVFIGGHIIPEGGALSAENCLGISCAGNVTIGDNAHSGNVEAHLHGAIFCGMGAPNTGEVSLYHTSSSFKGSMLCDTIYGDKPNIVIETDPTLPEFVPSSMPALGGIIFKGTWTRN